MAFTLSITLLGRLPTWIHDLRSFQSLFALCYALYALALLGLKRYARVPRAGLVVLAVAIATRAALFPVVPSLSGDLYRYVWEGRVTAHGGNPYRQSPLDPRLAPLRDREVFPNINHKELSTIYPPLAEAGFALVARISQTVSAMKLWVVLHDLLLVALLLAWAKRRGASAVPVIAYAWNPLVLVEYAGSGHNDPTAMLWLILAIMWVEERPILSALTLGIGALVKLVPLLALPFLIRRWPWRSRILCGVILSVGLGWFRSQTRDTYSGLIASWGTWRNNELLFHYVDRWAGSFERARSISLVLVAAALAWGWWKRWGPAHGTRLGVRSGVLVSPVVHPWYLGWALAFEPLGPSAPWLLLSGTAILNYGLFSTPAEGRSFHLPLVWRWVEYGLPLLVATVIAARAFRGRTRHAHPKTEVS